MRTPDSPRLILASASPRRRELLACLGVSYEVVPADINEAAWAATLRPPAVARKLARAKSHEIQARHADAVVLAADTIVVDRGQILGKPRCDDEAWAMLQQLRNRWHRVITGVAVASGKRMAVTHVTTRVKVRAYSDSEIERYMARGEPFDKAGGYAIQDAEFHPVEQYESCHCNVVGLPLGVVCSMLRRAGLVTTPTTLPEPCATCPLFREHPDDELSRVSGLSTHCQR